MIKMNVHNYITLFLRKYDLAATILICIQYNCNIIYALIVIAKHFSHVNNLAA